VPPALLIAIALTAGAPPPPEAPVAPQAAAQDAAASPLAGGCAERLTVTEREMGTRASISLCPRSLGEAGASEARAAAQVGFAEMARLEKLWSTWLPASDISRLNRAAGREAVAVAPETVAILERALAGSRATAGVFDVTFAPLAEVWRFDTPPGSHRPTKLAAVPSEADIEARLARIGWRGLHVDRAAGTAKLDRPGMLVNLGGIGKGAAVDRVVAELRRRGFRDFTVQLGGDLYCAGNNGARPWRVGIAHPRQPGQVLAAVAVHDAAFSTSGDYERFALIDGRRYHHIMDLRTGWPATASQSATVLAPTAIDAEIFTKTAFILGGAAGIEAVEGAGGQAVIVTATGEALWSASLPRLAR
jgi:thiamine biosynthesis lipoprotein